MMHRSKRASTRVAMKIVKYHRGSGRNLDLFIAMGHSRSFVLEWSGPTREESGYSQHGSIETAMVKATKVFGITLDGWEDGDPFDCAPWRRGDELVTSEKEAVLLSNVWEIFSWSAPQIPQLVDTFQIELNHLITKYEEEKEQYSNDADERSINRAWCDELAITLRRWCSLLELDPDDIPNYRKAVRQSVWNEDLIRTDAIPPKVYTLLQSRAGTTDTIFRPVCLELAHKNLLRWLQLHPTYVDRVHHRTFEAIIGEVIRSAGWSVELTKQTRDGGYDIMCLRNDSAGFPVRILVETKLYSLDRAVGLPMVDRLMGVRDRERADRAVLVTNSRFSGVVWTLWEERVGRDLTLIDREELLEWLREGQAKV